MSCNIYEDPDQTMKVKYSKEVRGKGWRKMEKEEKVEKEVDIYKSPETLTCHQANPSRKARGVQTQKRPPTIQRNCYKVATVTLGGVCLLLMAGISVLLSPLISLKCKENSLSQNQTQEKLNQSIKEWQELRESYFYYASTEKKNWTESRKDCQSRGGDLVILNTHQKQEMIRIMKIHGDSWIGLQVPDEWRMRWKWVDGSDLVFRSWKKGINTQQNSGFKAFTDQQGLWMFAKTGLKYWICEKRNVRYLGDLTPGKSITNT